MRRRDEKRKHFLIPSSSFGLCADVYPFLVSSQGLSHVKVKEEQAVNSLFEDLFHEVIHLMSIPVCLRLYGYFFSRLPHWTVVCGVFDL